MGTQPRIEADIQIIPTPVIPIIPETIPEKIERYSLKYNVNPITVNKVISCESNYNPNNIGDNGTSFGLVQIHLPAHPNITKSQALDPDFAIDYLTKNLKAGNGRMWTCYRNRVLISGVE